MKIKYKISLVLFDFVEVYVFVKFLSHKLINFYHYLLFFRYLGNTFDYYVSTRLGH